MSTVATPADTAASTYAVVATCVVLVRAEAVGALGVPVNAGEASGAKPEIEAPEGIVTVPVNVGEANGALRSSAVWVAEETALLASLVFSTLPRPTIVAVIPLTVPVKVGLALGAASVIPKPLNVVGFVPDVTRP